METYEEKYKDLVKRLNKAREEKGVYTFNSVLDAVAPELKIDESKDEKTKRVLHTIANKMSQHLRDIFTEEEFQCFDVWSNAWLEKQGEPKEINPSEFDSQLNRLLGQFKSLPKEELASSLSFYLNVVQNDGTYKEEKQGEQKPAWSEEDRENSKYILYILNQLKGNTIYSEDKIAENCIDWLKSLKDRVQPKQEWSVEDEKMIDAIYSCVDSHYDGLAKTSLLIWLKSLRPQTTWKPSNEQMHYLSWIANVKLGDSVVEQDVSKHLNELLEDLKKLKG